MKQTGKKQVRRTAHFSFISMAAGCIATVPMTLFLLCIQRILPDWQRYALPPEEVTRELAQRTHMQRYLDKPRLLASSIIFHFSYGTTMGGLYGLLTRQLRLPAFLKGAAFGFIIWAASYLGWMPLAHISVAAPREPLSRNFMMIIAHILWGAVTGILSDRLINRALTPIHSDAKYVR